MNSNIDKYKTIINLPHPTSKTHPRMSISDRAAQFSPFAALTGFEATIVETARLTEKKVELDEYEKAEINEKINILRENIHSSLVASITYFLPDDKKDGGRYVTAIGSVKKFNEETNCLILHDEVIPVEDIIYIDLQK